MHFDISKTVAFTGHRELRDPKTVSQKLDAIIEQMYTERGHRVFLSGMAVGFDLLAAEAVLRAKRRHPAIQLVAVIPFMGQELHYKREDRIRYIDIFRQADDKVFVADLYTGSQVYLRRDDYLVDNSALLISYYSGRPSGTGYTVHYAEKKGKPVINLM